MYATQFKGSFDGQGNTISGIYLTDTYSEATSSHYHGLFGQTELNTTICNFELINSYFESTNGANGYAMMGSIVGQLKGNLHTVKSDAIVVSGFRHVGGLVGRTNSDGSGDECTITNCWFDGTLNVSEDTLSGTNGGVGGIVGRFVQGKLQISDCLNTGDISYTATSVSGSVDSYYTYLGGIIGYARGSEYTSVTNCMNAGMILL